MTTPQHWRCDHCHHTYTSPLPLRRPPAHWCHPAGGRRRLRDFTLNDPSPPPKPGKAADGDSFEARLADNTDFDPYGVERFP